MDADISWLKPQTLEIVFTGRHLSSSIRICKIAVTMETYCPLRGGGGEEVEGKTTPSFPGTILTGIEKQGRK